MARDRNPVTLAHAGLPNYLGEFDHPDLVTLEPGNWLYDRGRHELVYLVRRARNFSGGTDPVPAIRFRLRIERTPSGSYSPFLLHVVTPYEWGRRAAKMLDVRKFLEMIDKPHDLA